jgi:hypothetical protein
MDIIKHDINRLILRIVKLGLAGALIGLSIALAGGWALFGGAFATYRDLQAVLVHEGVADHVGGQAGPEVVAELDRRVHRPLGEPDAGHQLRVVLLGSRVVTAARSTAGCVVRGLIIVVPRWTNTLVQK